MSLFVMFRSSITYTVVQPRSGQLLKQNAIIPILFFFTLQTGRNAWYIGEKSDQNVFICQTTVSM